MLKEAIQYIVGMSTPTVKEIGGEIYSDKSLHRINHNPKADPIRMNTLTSLIDYLKSDIDVKPHDSLFIHVQSPSKVVVYTALDADREREYLVEANAQPPAFNFNQFMDHETFCIGLQSKFIDTGDRALLLKFAGTVEAGSVSEYGDDGISQKATIKTGIASKGDAIVPNPVDLKPFRTFFEVDQPASPFVFRMKQDGRGEIQCAIFEADGGAWKSFAMANVKEYLKEKLSEYGAFVIIS